MNDKILPKDEIDIRLIMLQLTAEYLKENHIDEQSETGQLIVGLDRQLEAAVTKALNGSDTN